MAKELVELADRNSKLSHLKELSNTYIESNTLKKSKYIIIEN